LIKRAQSPTHFITSITMKKWLDSPKNLVDPANALKRLKIYCHH